MLLLLRYWGGVNWLNCKLLLPPVECGFYPLRLEAVLTLRRLVFDAVHCPAANVSSAQLTLRARCHHFLHPSSTTESRKPDFRWSFFSRRSLHSTERTFYQLLQGLKPFALNSGAFLSLVCAFFLSFFTTFMVKRSEVLFHVSADMMLMNVFRHA